MQNTFEESQTLWTLLIHKWIYPVRLEICCHLTTFSLLAFLSDVRKYILFTFYQLLKIMLRYCHGVSYNLIEIKHIFVFLVNI